MLLQRLFRNQRNFLQFSKSNQLQPIVHRRLYAAEVQPEAATSIIPAIKLRDYQEECIQAVLEHQERGHRRLGVSLATGGGKTVIFTELIDRVKPLSPESTRTLIVVHRRELVEQAARQCERTYPHKTIEVEMGKSHSTGAADITVASVMSLISADRIKKFDPKKFKLILIDEVHHAAAKSYIDTLTHFDAMKPDAPVNVVGVSATMSRIDGLRLGAIMDHIVYHRNFMEMIDEGWLSQMMFTTIKTDVDLSTVRLSGGDFNLNELSLAVNTDEANDITVRSWMDRSGHRKSTLVFCVDIAHVKEMANKFRSFGYDAQYVTSETDVKERGRILNAFKAGEFPVLVNCGIFTEGTDIPNIDCVVLARPTRSRNLLVQMIGRGMRLSPGKEDCHVLDLVGSVTKGIVTTPTLYGLDPSEVVKESSPEDLKKLAAKREREAAKRAAELPVVSLQDTQNQPNVPRNVTFTHYDSIKDLVEDARYDNYIRRLSPFAWVGVSGSKYILGLGKRGFLRLEREAKGTFTVWDVRSLDSVHSVSPFMTPRQIVKGVDSLEQAVHAADTYAEQRVHRQQLLWNVPWRDKPATEAQMEFLRKLYKDEMKKTHYTMGMAGDAITKLKHGAKKELDKHNIRVRKAQRLEKRNAKHDALGVGPINA